MNKEITGPKAGRLLLYRKVFQHPLVKGYRRLQKLWSEDCDKEELLEAYWAFAADVLEGLTSLRWRWEGDGWKALILEILLAEENLFTLKAEALAQKSPAADLLALASRDLAALEELAGAAEKLREAVAQKCGLMPENLPDWNLASLREEKEEPWGIRRRIYQAFLAEGAWEQKTRLLAEYYGKIGAGILGSYYAFRWQGEKLWPVTNRDPVCFAQLHGYEREQGLVIENTRQFLAGLPANNVLLYGDRGTGKSSTVKALINAFGSQGLRLVEITKKELTSLPLLLERLQKRGLHFIVFIDDLSFGEQDVQYAALKAVLEGGVSVTPSNVRIYATSNRRHFLPERFSDRPGLGDDELRSGDTLQEKLSLADRFGMTVTFLSPDQKGYLAIVESLAEERGLAIGREELRRRALEWELHQNMRSPRTARQFIDQLQGKMGLDCLE